MKNKGIGVSNWKIIVEPQSNGTNITYGTGWYYVEAGKTVDGLGKLTRGYIINYDERKAVKFDGSKHAMLADGAGIAAGKDYLICNIDPSAIEAGSTDFGEGVEFVGYNLDALGRPINAFTNTSFIFDGVDDYIKIKYDSVEQKQRLAENGFTFEFYGIVDEGTSYNEKNEIINHSYKGLFTFRNHDNEGSGAFRFGIERTSSRTTFKWNAGYKQCPSDFMESTRNMHNIHFPYEISNTIDTFITVVLDTSNIVVVDGVGYYKEYFYVNGEKLHEGNYNKNNWDWYVEQYLPVSDNFDLGRAHMSDNNWWHYSKMNCNSLRLYSKGLTENEVKANYNATVAYHNILAGGGDAGTGGATGGDDF